MARCLGAPPHRRVHRIRLYPNVFVGQDAVSCLVSSGVAADRAHAVALGSVLQQAGYMHHVHDDHDFADQWLFFRFYVDEVDLVNDPGFFSPIISTSTKLGAPLTVQQTSLIALRHGPKLLPLPRHVPWRLPAHVWSNSIIISPAWADAFHRALGCGCVVQVAAQVALLRRIALAAAIAEGSAPAVPWRCPPRTEWETASSGGGVVVQRLRTFPEPGVAKGDMGGRGVSHFSAYRSSTTLPLPLPLTGALITSMRARVQWDPMCAFAQCMGPAFLFDPAPTRSASAEGGVSTSSPSSGAPGSTSPQSTPPARMRSASHGVEVSIPQVSSSASLPGMVSGSPTAAARKGQPTPPAAAAEPEEELMSQRWAGWWKKSPVGRALAGVLSPASTASPAPPPAPGGDETVATGVFRPPGSPPPTLPTASKGGHFSAALPMLPPTPTVSPYTLQARQAAQNLLQNCQLLYRRMQAVSVMGSMRDSVVLQDVFVPPTAWVEEAEGGKGSPLPVSVLPQDAPGVVEAATKDPSPSHALLLEVSLKHRAAPPLKGLRRADVMMTVYHLAPCEGGAATRVTLLSQLHLAGKMPIWASGTLKEFQTAQPLRQLADLARRLVSEKGPEALQAAAKGASAVAFTRSMTRLASGAVAAQHRKVLSVTASPLSARAVPTLHTVSEDTLDTSGGEGSGGDPSSTQQPASPAPAPQASTSEGSGEATAGAGAGMSPMCTEEELMHERIARSFKRSGAAQPLEGYESDGSDGEEGGGDAADMPVTSAGKVGPKDFMVLAVLGRGGYGKVLLVQHTGTRALYAMKTLKKSAVIRRKQVGRTMVEKLILERVAHPFIVNLVFSFQTRKKLYMVMEYVMGGDLFTLLSTRGLASEPRARLYMAEMILALEHLHAAGVVYRDLKPENVLLDAEGHLKLTDFGLSRLSNREGQSVADSVASAVASATHLPSAAEEATFSFCGTEQYMAPEMLLQKGAGAAADWFSLGIVFSEMMTGRHPFRGASHLDTLRNIVNPNVPPATVSSLSPSAGALLVGLLHVDPERRLGSEAAGGVAALKSAPFFAGVDWDVVAARGYQPLYVPRIQGGADTSNFDTAFTREAPVDSTASSVAGADPDKFAAIFAELPFTADGRAGDSGDTWRFPGFSFADQDALGEAVADAVDEVLGAGAGQ